MKQAIILYLLISGLSSIHAETSSAAERESRQHRLFSSFDKNNDGKLTKEEFVAKIIADLFSQFDQNKNGEVSRKEFLEYSKKQSQARKEYPILDPSNKGFITVSDVYRHKAFILELESAFKQLDRNAKGYITISSLPDLTPNH